MNYSELGTIIGSMIASVVLAILSKKYRKEKQIASDKLDEIQALIDYAQEAIADEKITPEEMQGIIEKIRKVF